MNAIATTPLPRIHDERAIALAFIRRHDAEHLAPAGALLVQRCTDELQQRFPGMGRQQARDLAAQAYGEYASEGAGHLVDLDRSTAYCIFLRPNRIGAPCSVTVLTVPDLLRAVELLRAERERG